MLRSKAEQEDPSEEARQDFIDQVVEAIREIEIVVNVPKPGVAVEVNVPKLETPVINVTAQAPKIDFPKIDFPKPIPNPFCHGAVVEVTKRNYMGFAEQFTIKPIKP
jgi:hypothetical protein